MMPPGRALWLVVATAAACSPLRQPLGSLTPTGSTSGAAGARSDAGTAGPGTAGGSGTGTWTTSGAAGTPIGTTGTAGSTLGTAGAAGTSPTPDAGMPPDMLTGTQIPALPPEWSACNLDVLRCYQDPRLSPSSPVSALFSGTADPEPMNKPMIVYPLPGSLHPINLADITFQWRRGPGVAQTVFRIRLKRTNGDAFEFYVPCDHTTVAGPAVGVECVSHLPPGAWIDLATTVHGETLTVDVTGVDPTHPNTVAMSDPMSISFSREYVSGGLTYWTESLSGMARVLFGARAALPYVVPGQLNGPTTCVSCHSVSRDGSTIAFSAGDAATASLRVARTADADTALFPPATAHDSATLALTHDGGRVLVSVAGRLFLRDTMTGATLATIDDSHLGNLHGFHPEFSPDDSSVVLTLSAQGDSDWSVGTGAIGVLPYTKDVSGAGAFGQAEILVDTGTEFNFYPTWSPDGQWIAFATAPVGALQSSYIQNNARLRIVNRATKAVFNLANATYKAGRTSTWPKFAPVAQMDGLMFLTFNSKNDYGFVRPNNAGGFPQMWMTSIDPKKLVAGGGDASTAPVWLPFQDPTKHSYLGCWSERVGCRLVGTQSIGCGDHEICSNGACAMVSP